MNAYKSIDVKIFQYHIRNNIKLALHLKNLTDRTIGNYLDSIVRFLDFIHYDKHFDIVKACWQFMSFLALNLN